LSTIEIAKICGVYNQSQICKWLKKHNIKARSRKEAQIERYEKGRSPLLGRELPNKTKEKISKTLKGKYIKEKSHMYGKKGEAHQRWGVKHTEEIKRIIGEKSRGRKQSKETIEKRMKHLRGKKRPPFSQEWKDNISKATKKLWANPEFIKKVTQKRSENAKRLCKNEEWLKKTLFSPQRLPTKPEKLFNEMTPDIINYVGNRKFWIMLPTGKRKNPDFKIENQNKVIEVFGDYWHRGENPQELIDLYKQAGLDCLVIWEHEIYKKPDIILKKVNNFLRFRQDMSPV